MNRSNVTFHDPRHFPSRYVFAQSEDGIHWKKIPRFGPLRAYLGDVATISFDMDVRTYVLNTRHPFMGTAWSDLLAPTLSQFMRL